MSSPSLFCDSEVSSCSQAELLQNLSFVDPALCVEGSAREPNDTELNDVESFPVRLGLPDPYAGPTVPTLRDDLCTPFSLQTLICALAAGLSLLRGSEAHETEATSAGWLLSLVISLVLMNAGLFEVKIGESLDVMCPGDHSS
jgi:hypothetical protein